MTERTKALAISPAVKKVVAERDSLDGQTCCIICGSPDGLPEAHYVPRSQGGLGIEENIVTLCRECHRAYDQSPRRKEIGEELRIYLKWKYPDWDEGELTYRRKY